jgi:hypothetical protein
MRHTQQSRERSGNVNHLETVDRDSPPYQLPNAFFRWISSRSILSDDFLELDRIMPSFSLLFLLILRFPQSPVVKENASIRASTSDASSRFRRKKHVPDRNAAEQRRARHVYTHMHTCLCAKRVRRVPSDAASLLEQAAEFSRTGGQ